MGQEMDGLLGKEIGNYTYTYRYYETEVTQKIKEYYQEEKDIRAVILEKETRKGDSFVRLPRSLWITREGYPPLSTDGVIQQVFGKKLTLYYAGLPTVQSEEHMRIFEDTLRKELKGLGLDYDQLSQAIKGGGIFRGCTLVGFIYMKKGEHDPEILKHLQEKVVKAYGEVLKCTPQKCPVHLWTDMIMGPQAEFEYHLFKKEGFEVPLSAQKAFFTILVGPRESYLKSNEELQRVEDLIKRIT
jgi:hypothetical protein